MGKLLMQRIGSASSSTFFQIGNSLNLANFRKPSTFINIKIPKTDLDALKSDWNVVGTEVRVAIDRFEKEKISGRNRNIEFRDYTEL